MCSRHSSDPNGADGYEEVPAPWNVTIVERHDPDARPRRVTLKAYGRNDVNHQVEDMGDYLILEARAAA